MTSKTKEGAAQAAPSPTLAEIAKLIRVDAEAMQQQAQQADRTKLEHARYQGALLRQAREHFPARPASGWSEWLQTKAKFPHHRATAALWIQLADPAIVVSTRQCTSIEQAIRVMRGPRKPKSTSEPKPKKPTAAGKRMHAAKMGRAEAKRNGRPAAFWEIGWDVTRLVYGLASWKVEDVPLDYDNLNAITTVEEDLLYLYDWMDETLSLIHSRMGEHGMRQQLRKLQARTVENGCTPEEAENAARAAKRLQRKIDNVLEAAS